MCLCLGVLIGPLYLFSVISLLKMITWWCQNRSIKTSKKTNKVECKQELPLQMEFDPNSTIEHMPLYEDDPSNIKFNPDMTLDIDGNAHDVGKANDNSEIH
jgi:hypothetical protein